jgi:hypothetical protein
MDSQVQYIFLLEVKRQTKFALMSLEDMESALVARDTDRIWFCVQAFLVAVGNLSKLLWPHSKYGERGEFLRRELGVPDDSPLGPRTFRNHFEHFDERLEAWLASDGSRNFVDSNIGPPGAIAGFGPSTFHRNLDPESMTVTFRGDACKIQLIVADLRRLSLRVDQLMS